MKKIFRNFFALDFFAFGLSGASANLTLSANFDTSITTDADAATIEDGIDQAIATRGRVSL